MVQARSSRYDVAAWDSGRTANARAKVLGKDREIKAILDLAGSDGIQCDRAGSSTRIWHVDVAGGEHAPDTLDDLLAPGVNRIQVEVGLRLEDTAIVTQVNGPGYGWAVSGQSLGVNTLTEDENGWLTLGGAVEP